MQPPPPVEPLIGKLVKIEIDRWKETWSLPLLLVSFNVNILMLKSSNHFLFLLQTTEMANSDLDKYYKALDKYALNNFVID